MYHGEVEVEDDEFYMKFDKFILRDTEIAFEIVGTDDEGDFKTDGVARQIGTGEYRADVTVEYPTYFVNQRYQGRDTWKGPAVIIITEASTTPQGRRCNVKGQWLQNGERWCFHGELTKRVL